jgi:hypothetical protein
MPSLALAKLTSTSQPYLLLLCSLSPHADVFRSLLLVLTMKHVISISFALTGFQNGTRMFSINKDTGIQCVAIFQAKGAGKEHC